MLVSTSHERGTKSGLFAAGLELSRSLSGKSIPFPQPRDDLFLLLNQRVELRNLDGVVALLVLPKAKQVRKVLGPPAMKEELVLGDNREPQLFEAIGRRGGWSRRKRIGREWK